MTETGSIPDPDLLRTYEADWSWFTTWSGEFIDDGEHNPLPFLRKVYEDDYVITLDELGDWRSHPRPGPAEPRSAHEALPGLAGPLPVLVRRGGPQAAESAGEDTGALRLCQYGP